MISLENSPILCIRPRPRACGRASPQTKSKSSQSSVKLYSPKFDLLWFITACKHPYARNVGVAPLQRHPTVAVALVCVSAQITAARVAPCPKQGKFCTASARKFGHEGNCRGSSGDRPPVHLFLFTTRTATSDWWLFLFGVCWVWQK
jgi:hypothetical protein